MESVVWSDVKKLIDESKIEIDPDESIHVNCGQCKKIMIEPRQIICGCRICLECLTDYLRNGGKHCPVGATSACRGIELSSLDDVFVDKESIRKILNVPVHCSVTGCDVESPLEDMLEHLNSCRIINGDNVTIINNSKKGNEINMTLKCRVDLMEELLTERIQGINDMMDKFDLRLKNLEKVVIRSNSRLKSLDTKVDDIVKKVNKEMNDDFVWKIDNYWDKKVNGTPLYSDSFYTKKNGYKLRMKLLPNNDTNDGAYLSLYFQIMKGEYDDILPWPFKYDVTMCVMDQKLSSRDHCRSIKYPTLEKHLDIYEKPEITDYNCIGCTKFLSVSTLQSSSYLLKNDTLYIRFSITKV